jgi:hypothetical protein
MNKCQFGSLVKLGSWMAFLFLVNSISGICAIIPADRQIAWQGNVGVAGGIPLRTSICATIAPTGGDDSSAIQNALNSCSQNSVVKLTSGVFHVSRTIDWGSVRNGVVLRGDGPDKTTITFSSGNMLMRAGYISESALSTEVNLASDAVKGQNTINLTSVPSWITVGNYYILDQLDDPSFVFSGGTEGGRSYREIVGNGPRGLGQMVKVVSKTSNQIAVEMPLYYGFRVAQTAQLAQPAIIGSARYQCGIEDLRLTATYTSSNGHMITMMGCDNCWVKNVQSENAAGGCHVMMHFCYRCEIRDSYFSDCHIRTAGQAYGVALYHVSTGCLVENNIFKRLHAGMMACYGASGNVFGYNYELDGIADSGQVAALSTHGVHAYMNLWEGNYSEDKALGDWTHGSSSHNTLFRNRIVGYHSGATLDQTAVSVEIHNRKWNIIGNILGMNGWHSIYSACASGECSQSSCVDVSKIVLKLGFEVNWACSRSQYDSYSVLDPIVHGNYDVVQKKITWDANISDQNFPSSLYLANKPSWFGTLSWPAYDSRNPANDGPTQIPAGYRYINGKTPGAAPAAPKNLRVS